MKSRFSTVAGFLAAATLLSGSAFAFAPEFTGDLPTVIITDRISDGSNPAPFDAPNGGWSVNPTDFRPSSAFLFRYETNLDLANIIDLRDASSINDVKVVFNEFDNVDPIPSVPNSVTTLNINGANALPALPQTSDFAGSNAFTAGLLSFRNIDFSPGTGDGPFDQIGNVTGQDLQLTPTQERIVTLNINTADANTYSGKQAKSFLVVTTIDGTEGDRVTATESTDPFSSIYTAGNGGNFDGWAVKLWDNRVLGINSNGPSHGNDTIGTNYSGVTISPTPLDSELPAGISVGDTVPANHTGTLNLTTNNAQVGLFAWGVKNNDISLTVGKLYRFRASIASPNITSTSLLGIQFGEVFDTGVIRTGYMQINQYLAPAAARQYPKPPTSKTDFEGYLLARGSGTTDFNIQIIDAETNDGQDLVIYGVDIAEADRADLANPAILVNYGGTGFAVRAGELAPPASPTPFKPLGATPVARQDVGPGNSLNAAVPDAYVATASVLNAQMGPAPPNTNTATSYQEFQQFQWWTENPLNVNTMQGFTVDNDHLYICDVWASTSAPGAVLPNLLIRNNIDITQFTWAAFWVGNATELGVGFSNPNLYLTSDAKVYSNVFRPQSPNSSAQMNMEVGGLFAIDSLGELANSTTRIHRVVITQYDAPN